MDNRNLLGQRRDLFAAAALIGYIASGATATREQYAQEAAKQADALISALNCTERW